MSLTKEISDSFKYWLLIGVIAVITVLAYMTASRMIVTSEESAAIINTAGRQRMYSQRIASFAAQYALGSQTARTDLITAVANFESNTKELHERMDNLGRGLLANTDAPVYTESLNNNIKRYITRARKVSELPIHTQQFNDELSALFDQSKEPLLREIDQLVLSEQQFVENHLDKIAKIQMTLFCFILIMLVAGALIIVRPLELDTKRLRTLSEIDTLTGAYSRRMFIDRTTKEFNYAQKEGKPFSLLMIDVDYFKKINDVFGHAGGDVALTTLVAHISHLIHSSDYIGRLGGEEFAVVMPETSIDEALVVAERIRLSVDNLMLPYGNRYIKLSISIGVAALTDEVNNVSTLLKLADNALYVAKAQGRNKVTANKLNLVA